MDPLPPLNLNKILTTEDEIERVFELILHRAPGDAAYVRETLERGLTGTRYIRELIGSPEFERNFRNGTGLPDERRGLEDAVYRVPSALSRATRRRMRIMLIGSCMMDSWPPIVIEQAASQGIELTIDRVTFNNASALPPLSDAEAAAIDFAIIQLPLRSVLIEADFFGLRPDDLAGHQAAFQEACRLLRLNLDQALAHQRRHGMRCYVGSFLVPQQNPTGRMLPRYSLGNLAHMVEELNRELWTLCENRPGVQWFDLDSVSAMVGRRYVQDDAVLHSNHGGMLGHLAHWGDDVRIEPIGEVDVIYTRRTRSFVQSAFQEVLAMHRTLLQQDSVKIVLCDLDDTLWRGVAAEQTHIRPEMVEGWPLGVLEALDQLWRRGVLVALVSKNDEAIVRQAWRQLYQPLFPFERFVARRINWAPKAENIREILEAVNLLPESAVFLDDNPRERGEVRKAIPGLRVIDAPAAEWRRILLWSAETQRAEVNEEALNRTGTVQAQIQREEERGALDPAAFMQGLGLRVALGAVSSEADAHFGRCFELLNKTNQYNTTGRRWSTAEMRQLFAGGGFLLHLTARDKYALYGLTAVAVIQGSMIEQVVMSCRVFGMEVERALLGTALATIRSGNAAGPARARLMDTGANRLCHELFAANGFVPAGDGTWEAPESLALYMPAHIGLGLD